VKFEPVNSIIFIDPDKKTPLDELGRGVARRLLEITGLLANITGLLTD
jgi:hypothetical protein